MTGSFLVSGVLAIGLLIYGRTILSFWLGEAEAEASAEILWYLTIAYWLLAINVVPHFILLGVGRMRFVALSNLAAGIVLSVAMVILMQLYGVVGVAIARIVYGVIILVNCLSLIQYLRRKREESVTHTNTKLLVEGI
jgi:O-antigen/teichoic acid export membrane protein